MELEKRARCATLYTSLKLTSGPARQIFFLEIFALIFFGRPTRLVFVGLYSISYMMTDDNGRLWNDRRDDPDAWNCFKVKKSMISAA